MAFMIITRRKVTSESNSCLQVEQMTPARTTYEKQMSFEAFGAQKRHIGSMSTPEVMREMSCARFKSLSFSMM